MTLCLITEGTYPYHVGGVSTWTHALLQGLPDLNVVLVSLYAGPDAPEAPRWTLPDNVSLLRLMRVPDTLDRAEIEAWSTRAASSLPPIDLVHALTAGVAGQLGRALRAAREIPLVVTEHGIGWHELQHGAGETETGFRPDAGGTCWAQQVVDQAVQDLRDHARAVYAAADRLTAVAWATRQKQVALGVDPSRCQVIPNGVEVPSLPPGPSASPLHLGLVGRVTPLKDIVTFLRACARVRAAVPAVRFSVVGPPSDPEYAARCHTLAETLGLSGALSFVEDACAMSPWYARFDVVALTSRSEAQPLALLEAMAHARPVVATDVGDCRRLVTGPTDPFGPAGIVCAPGDVDAVAQALVTLARSPARRREQGQAGWRRVRASYRQDQTIAAYRGLYADLCSSPVSLFSPASNVESSLCSSRN